MARTTADRATAASWGLASGESSVFGLRYPVADPEIASSIPTGMIASTAADMARWARFHLGDGALPGGGRLLEPDSMALLHDGAVDMLMPPAEGHTAWRYGMGFWDFELDTDRGPARIVQHSGTTSSYASELILMPEDGVAAVALIGANGLVQFPGNVAASAYRAYATGQTAPTDEVPIAGGILVAAGLALLGWAGAFALLRSRSRRRAAAEPGYAPSRAGGGIALGVGILLTALVVGGLAALMLSLGRLDLWNLGYVRGMLVGAPDVGLIVLGIAVVPLALGIASVAWRRRRARAVAAR